MLPHERSAMELRPPRQRATQPRRRRRRSVGRGWQRDGLDVLALEPAQDPVMGALRLEREPALALLGIVLKYVLEPAKRALAVERDVEQRAHAVVVDRSGELHHVAITGSRALVGNGDVSLAALVDLIGQFVVVGLVEAQYFAGFAVEKPPAVTVAILEGCPDEIEIDREALRHGATVSSAATSRQSRAPTTQRLEASAQFGLDLVLRGEREQVAVAARLAAEQERQARRRGPLSVGCSGVVGRHRAELREQRGHLLDELGAERGRLARSRLAPARPSGSETAAVAEEPTDRMAATGHGALVYTVSRCRI